MFKQFRYSLSYTDIVILYNQIVLGCTVSDFTTVIIPYFVNLKVFSN